MTQAAEAREVSEPSEAESVPAPASSRELTLHWPRSVPRPSRFEVALIVGLSALLHVSVGAAALGARDTTRPKPLSRVQVALERAPARPAPPPREAPPPPPPPRARPLAKSEAPRPTPAPVAAPSEAPVAAAPPPDTGSSAAPAEGGELFAGSGGLGTAAPTPPAPPAPLPKKPEPAPVVQAHEGANYLKNPRPPYPSLARRQGWEGTTLLRVQVSPSGKPGAVQVQRTSGRTALDDAALEAVKRWTFVPATQGGAPVSGWVTVPIVFRLQ